MARTPMSGGRGEVGILVVLFMSEKSAGFGLESKVPNFIPGKVTLFSEIETQGKMLIFK